jgi:neutral amino acid transport system permease protein
VVILGGTARNWTVMVGALAYGLLYGVTRFISFPPLSYLDSAQLAYLRLIIIGALMIGLMAFRPQGIFGKREEVSLD